MPMKVGCSVKIHWLHLTGAFEFLIEDHAISKVRNGLANDSAPRTLWSYSHYMEKCSVCFYIGLQMGGPKYSCTGCKYFWNPARSIRLSWILRIIGERQNFYRYPFLSSFNEKNLFTTTTVIILKNFVTITDRLLQERHVTKINFQHYYRL